MTAPTFSPTLNPSVNGTKKETNVRILETTFGNGYTQRSPDGFNVLPVTPTLQWDLLNSTQLAYIETFLETQMGAYFFYYTLPGESTPRKFTCKKWVRGYLEAGFYSFMAMFTEQFDTAT